MRISEHIISLKLFFIVNIKLQATLEPNVSWFLKIILM